MATSSDIQPFFWDKYDGPWRGSNGGSCASCTNCVIWGDNVVLAHVESSQDLKAPNYGRTFAWTGETGGGDNLALVESYREDTKRSDVHRARHDVDEKVTGNECAYLLTDVLA